MKNRKKLSRFSVMASKSKKLVVHMIGNAHLDPAWLWTWPAGTDEALNTCRTACELLEEYPEFHVTRGEAWVYAQIQKLDPALFRRVARFVRAGRWHAVNGWWIQPDCNLPGAESFRKQAEIGGRFFWEQLGVKVTVGYNVDSFGHCAMLPAFLREAGMNAYVFMRPNPSKLALPGELFRWRSPAGDEVTAFRIERAYSATGLPDLAARLDAMAQSTDRKWGHTMCFYGVGDHGGGPTRDQIEWIREHRHYGRGVELRFSHPEAFFSAVRGHLKRLPVFSSELQHYAVGCYSVVHDIKREVRRAEALLMQAEHMMTERGQNHSLLRGRLDEAWKKALFNQFHDILSGTCIRTACQQALEELGHARSEARDLLVELTRRKVVSLPPWPRQRLVIFNPSDRRWRGLAEFEPWLSVDGGPRKFILENEKGEEVPMQRIASEGLMDQLERALFPVDVPAGGRRILQIRRRSLRDKVQSGLHAAPHILSSRELSVSVGSTGISSIEAGGRFLLGGGGIQVGIFEDASDTWSHGVSDYRGACLGVFAADRPWSVLEDGPLRAALSNRFESEHASMHWIVAVEEGRSCVRMRLRLNWRGEARIVKLIIPPAFVPSRRFDGTPGAVLRRPLDGREYPVRDLMAVEGENACMAVVSPDFSAGDIRPDGTMRVTLLRCPIYAHHEPFPLSPRRADPVTDQGTHEYELILWTSTAFSKDSVLDEAHRLSHPLWISETTRGMAGGRRSDGKSSGTPMPPPDALLAGDLRKRMEVSAREVEMMDSRMADERWQGEKVLIGKGASMRIKLISEVDAYQRLAVARMRGGGWGGMELLLNGESIGSLPGSGSKARIRHEVLPEKIFFPKGESVLEFRRTDGRRMGLGFVHSQVIFRDIVRKFWRVAGSFLPEETPGAPVACGMEQVLKEVVYPPESRRDFKARMAVAGGKMGQWQTLEGDGDFVDFRALFGRGLGSIHYAATHVYTPEARRVRLSYGVDYYMRIWLNGRVAQDFASGENVCKGQLLLDVDLRKGWNELLVKVGSGSGGNGFWMAASEGDGLEFSAESHACE
ncbi:MAG: glycoside hydrolase family 38 C-terminal domain-containing protein [Verrucomicrobiae bacterium]|nr:glycoside hydrolase family 38 C-terminal domain-containing protein [Verrucomicrobiae bacterium]